jgi:hypothetical protein
MEWSCIDFGGGIWIGGIVERGILAPRMMFDRLSRKAKFLILRILLEHCLDSKDRDKIAPSGIEDHY